MNSFTRTESEDPVTAAERLIRRMHLRDGLPELSIGILFLLLACFNWVQAQEPFGSFISIASAIPFVLFCVFSTRIVKWVRRRYLVNRVGYVKGTLRESIKRRLARTFATVLLVSVAIGIAAFVIRPVRMDGWILAGTGMIFGAVYVLLGRILRFEINGILAAGAGLWLAFAQVPAQTGLATFFAFLGTVSLLSGFIVLIQILRKPIEAGEI